MSDNESIDWHKTTVEDNRREQLERMQAISVRQRLEALDELTELSKHIQAMSRKADQPCAKHEAFSDHESHVCNSMESDDVF